jgi:hypothetical protein
MDRRIPRAKIIQLELMHLLSHRGTVSSFDQEEKLLFLLGQDHLLRSAEGPY